MAIISRVMRTSPINEQTINTNKTGSLQTETLRKLTYHPINVYKSFVVVPLCKDNVEQMSK